MKNYLINGVKIGEIVEYEPSRKTVREKINQILEALDQTVGTKDWCDACHHYCNDCDIVDERCFRRPEHTCKMES